MTDANANCSAKSPPHFILKASVTNGDITFGLTAGKLETILNFGLSHIYLTLAGPAKYIKTKQGSESDN